MKLIKGADLTPGQRAEVKRAFMYRLTFENRRLNPDLVALAGGTVTQTDREWIAAHAFYFAGEHLATGQRYAEPAFLAE